MKAPLEALGGLGAAHARQKIEHFVYEQERAIELKKSVDGLEAFAVALVGPGLTREVLFWPASAGRKETDY